MELIKMSGIRKVFPGTVALDSVDFQLRQGEVVSLLGENGAGKTTLMKVLYGMYEPDAGSIEFKGSPVVIKKPMDAIRMGICMVHQHFMLVPAFTVTENIIAGDEPHKGILVDSRRARQEIKDLIDRFNFNINPDILVERLSVGEQQRVEILKALYRKAEVLILDEPTAVLTPREVDDLFVILGELRKQGTSIVIITHKLKETMSIADRVCVLRDGQMIDQSVLPAETTIQKLSEMMVGRKVELNVQERSKQVGEVCMSVRGLNVTEHGQKRLTDISFEIRRGEILGVAGIEGNGQTQLLESLTGLRTPDSMELTKSGEPLRGNADTFLRRGVGHVPEDRQSMGLVTEMGLRGNAILGYHREPDACKNGLLRNVAIADYAERCKVDYQIKVPTIDTPIRALSGGNQQKVVIARTFSHDPDVLIVAHPTRGVDVGAMEYIHHQLLALRDQGKGILLVSADLDEVRSLSDRLLVLYEGKIVSESQPDDFNEVQLGMLMTGSSIEAVKEAAQ